MRITVMGLGYLGSVAAAALASAGHEVLGVDVDASRVKALSRGDLQIYEPGLSDLMDEACRGKRLRFKTPDEVNEPLGEVVVVAVGTPPDATGAADLTQVKECISWIRDRQQDDGIVVMKSTVPPGTGVSLQEHFLRESRLGYVSNPEFLREGSAVYDWFNPHRIVVGASAAEHVDVLRRMYDDIQAPYVVSDVTSAEMAKYAANAFLATKISFINEIASLCDLLGAEIDDVVRSLSMDPRIGGSFLKAGVGYGGSCLPKDVRALDQVARTNNHSLELLRSVIMVNGRQRLLPLHALRERFGQLEDVIIAVLGLAFKPNTDDIRDAPAIELIRQLAHEGANVRAFDPRATERARKALPSGVWFYDDLMRCVEGAQAIALMTEWDDIVEADWAGVAALTAHPRFLFDGRNALVPSEIRGYGFTYMGVGRGRSKTTLC